MRVSGWSTRVAMSKGVHGLLLKVVGEDEKDERQHAPSERDATACRSTIFSSLDLITLLGTGDEGWSGPSSTQRIKAHSPLYLPARSRRSRLRPHIRHPAYITRNVPLASRWRYDTNIAMIAHVKLGSECFEAETEIETRTDTTVV